MVQDVVTMEVRYLTLLSNELITIVNNRSFDTRLTN